MRKSWYGLGLESISVWKQKGFSSFLVSDHIFTPLSDPRACWRWPWRTPVCRTNRSRPRSESWRWSSTEKGKWERVWSDSSLPNYRAEVWLTSAGLLKCSLKPSDRRKACILKPCGPYSGSWSTVSSASIQKRLKKEKKAKRKLQEALEFESKRRERVEDALKNSSSSSPSPEPLHAANNNIMNGGKKVHVCTAIISPLSLKHPADTFFFFFSS